MRAALSLANPPTVWGDGDADESWPDTVAVDRWALVEPDEYIRFFPALAGPDGVPPPLLDHLADAVTVLAWRCRGAVDGTTLVSAIDPCTGSATPGRWSVAYSSMRRLFGRREEDRAGSGSHRDQAGLRALDPLLLDLQNGKKPPFAEVDALALAFHGGVHPAYLWPEALSFHEIATAAGWLGLLARGRPAIMSLDTAQVLGEAIETETGHLRDDRLAFCCFAAAHWSTIGLAAGRRLQGVSTSVRLRRP